MTHIILSGLWLWWPRKWRWKTLISSIAMRFDVKGKARDFSRIGDLKMRLKPQPLSSSVEER